MIKVLYFIPNLGGGGAEKVLVNLVNNMDKSKFDITLQTLFDMGVNKQFLHNDVKYKYVFKRHFPASTKILSLFSPGFLYKRMIKDKYDIIVSYLEGVPARILSGNTDNAKKVSWIHCKFDNEATACVGFRNFEEAKKCYSKFDITIGVSKDIINYFTKMIGYTGKTDVLYNTLESDEVHTKSLETVNDITFSKDINICSAGKIEEVKGFKRLAEIHKRLIDNNIKNHIYILGVGSQQPEIEKYLNDNNLSNSFTFLGYKENPYKYISKCDLYVCSSYSEGLSTSVTEALISGTPVVTTLCPGMKELLGENNEYGLITENSTEALYNGIEKLIVNPELLHHYKEKAIERSKFFSKENTVKAVENMLENL